MCFSFESSIKSWFLALAGCLFLLAFSKNKNLSIWISAFTLTFTQIQVLEAIIWKTLEANKNADVSNIARYIPVLLWCQPFIQSIFGYIYTKNIFLLYLSFVYLFMIFMELNSSDTIKIQISKSGHLVWKRYRDGKPIYLLGDNMIVGLIYLFGLLAPLFFIDNEHFITKIGLIGFGVMSLLYSFTYGPDEFSSMWCYIAVNYILVAIIAEFFDDYM